MLLSENRLEHLQLATKMPTARSHLKVALLSACCFSSYCLQPVVYLEWQSVDYAKGVFTISASEEVNGFDTTGSQLVLQGGELESLVGEGLSEVSSYTATVTWTNNSFSVYLSAYAVDGLNITSNHHIHSGESVILTPDDLVFYNLSKDDCYIEKCAKHDPLSGVYEGMCLHEPCLVGVFRLSVTEWNDGVLPRVGETNAVWYWNITEENSYERWKLVDVLHNRTFLPAGGYRDDVIEMRVYYEGHNLDYRELYETFATVAVIYPREGRVAYLPELDCDPHLFTFHYDLYGIDAVLANFTVRYSGFSECEAPPLPPTPPLPPMLPPRPPAPPQNCYFQGDNGTSYFGFDQVTEGGHTCRPWNRSPIEGEDLQYYLLYPWLVDPLHLYFCRNPDEADRAIGGTMERPWCYTATSGVRWDYCDVPACPSPPCPPRPPHAPPVPPPPFPLTPPPPLPAPPLPLTPPMPPVPRSPKFPTIPPAPPFPPAKFEPPCVLVRGSHA
ncbi:hypothetical protein CYMTET_49735 [Cymbomonas tetramitiformis]|uniref:Kringle domain-containing protein n=1 Tax=Cymbomonas tetramitiformis TaxID=36881 RepID=A0AAE0BQR2_9CHLO|nr:hypothetical protein CYMTET_49735 [Cymbomonas tetramitiformis]